MYAGVPIRRVARELAHRLGDRRHAEVEHLPGAIDVEHVLGLEAVLYQFALEHPFWLSKGASSWTTSGLPAGMPSWCSIGAGKATIRTGTCDRVKTCPVPAL